ncbi:MAG: hypothetical protein AAGB22_05905 [Bacteroidota bacterium]
MSFRIACCYTANTPYEEEVQGLIQSVRQWGLKHHIRPFAHQGSWEKNCQHKAVFLRETLDRYSDNVVWLDADARIVDTPALFNTLEADFAFHYLALRNEVLSGTLFLRNNARVRALVDHWIRVNHTNRAWDQRNLQQILPKHPDLRVEHLPADYCKVFDLEAQVAANPVIVHYQASRRFRRQVNRLRPQNGAA